MRCAPVFADATRSTCPHLLVTHELWRAQTRCTVHVFDCTCDSTHGCDYQVPPAIRARVFFHFKVRVLASSSPYGRGQIQAFVCCKHFGSARLLLTLRAARAHASVCTKTMSICVYHPRAHANVCTKTVCVYNPRDFASNTCRDHHACKPYDV